MIRSWPHKTPTESYTRGIDWSDTITGKTIAASTWAVDEGTVTLGTASINGAANGTQVTVIGGTDGEMCRIRNRVQLNTGEYYEQVVALPIRING